MYLAYLLFWFEQPVNSQEVCVVIGAAIKQWVGGGIWTERSVSLLEKGTESKKNPKQMIFFRTGDDTTGSDLEVLRERWCYKAKLPVFPDYVSQKMASRVEDSGKEINWERKVKSGRSCTNWKWGSGVRERRTQVAYCRATDETEHWTSFCWKQVKIYC